MGQRLKKKETMTEDPVKKIAKGLVTKKMNEEQERRES
jgi:hypothetical protein